MRKIQTLFILIFSLILIGSTFSPVLAQDSSISEMLNTYNTDIGLGTGTAGDLSNINSIISAILPIAMILAGTILLFMLISGGFTMMTAISDPKAADAGKTRITAALTGFFLLFAAYWIIQILEIVLGVSILN